MSHRLTCLCVCILTLASLVLAAPAQAQLPAPGNFTATSISRSEIDLAWNTVTGAVSYNIYRSSASGGEGTTPYANTAMTSYPNTGLGSSSPFFYQVAAVASGGAVGTFSAEQEAVTAPTGVHTTAGDAEVALTWNLSGTSGVTYNVYRASGGAYTKITSSPVTTAAYLDTGVVNETAYTYEITALFSGKESVKSSPTAAVTPMLAINSGGPALTSSGATAMSGDLVSWGADNGLPSPGSMLVKTNTITNLPSGVPMQVFQSQRQSDGSYGLPGGGKGFVFNESSLPNGNYTLTLYFAEIGNSITAPGQRTFNVVINGVQVLTSFDIFAQAGGKYIAVAEAFPVTVTGGQFSLTCQDVIGKSLLAAFALSPPAQAAADIPPPGWAAGTVPSTGGSEADGDGPSSSIGVSLPSQIEENNPGADIWAYNPVGPRVSYERMYRGNHAGANGMPLYSSPGLSTGWTDNYDLTLTPGGGGFTLTYPNGAQESWAGTSGTLTTPAGAPYLAKVVDTGTVTMQFKDYTVFTFKKQTTASANGQYPANTYLLATITNLEGHFVTLSRAAASLNYEINDIKNDATPTATTLLHFTYVTPGGSLQSITDMESGQRQVNYLFTSGALTDVTWIEMIGTNFTAKDDHWVYSYTGGFLSQVATPDPSVINTGNLPATTTATVTLDAAGHVTKTTDARTAQQSFTAIPGGTQVTVAPLTGTAPPLTTTALYDSGKNTSAGERNGAGNTSSLYYDTVPLGYTGSPSPYLPSVGIDRNGHAVALTYDTTNTFGNVLTATDWRGTRSVMTYDYSSFPLGQVHTVTEEHVTGGTNPTNSTKVDAQKQAVTYDYYPASDPAWNGLPLDVISPAPDTTAGNAATVTTSYTYTGSGTSSLGNILAVTLPGNGSNGNASISIGYAYANPEAVGEPLTVTDGNSHSTSYTYDTRGNVLSMTDANSNTTVYTYNFADQLVAVTLPIINGGSSGALQVTAYQYPGGPVVSSALYPEGTMYSQVLLGTAPAPFRETKYNYDKEGEVTMTSDLTGTGTTFGPEATYAYDAQGRVTAQGDGLGQLTHYYYDGLAGTLQEMSYPNYPGSAPTYALAGSWSGISGADTESYGYDADENETSRVDGRGVTTTYTRADPESLVTQVGYSAVGGVTALNPVTLSYDDYGRRMEMSDIAGGTVVGTTDKTYTFDDLDELQTVTTGFYGGPQSQTMKYAHFNDGSRQTMTFGLFPVAGGMYTNYAFGYTYDPGHLLTQVNYPWHDGSATNMISHTYQPNNWLQTTTLPGVASAQTALTTSYIYNPRGYVTELLNQTAGGISASEFGGSGSNAMTYDTAGNRTSELEVVPAAPNGLGSGSPDINRTITYTYDNRNELTEENSVSHVSDYYTAAYDLLFGYDLAYNPQSFRATATTPAMYGFNTDNQTTSLLSGSLTAPVYDGDGGPSTYSAPTNGLTAGYNGVTFTFDGENRLTAGSSNGSTFPFTAYYDGDGMRTAFTTNNVTTYYLYDDESGGGVPVAELTYSSGNATTSLAYLNGMCADGWRLRYVVGAAYVETYDPQGSIVQSSLDNDALGPDGEYAKSVFVYDGFGALRGSASTSGSFPAHHRDPAGFGGEWGYYQDLSTGLEHLGARYYDGGTGRFVTRDPIGYGGGENLYAFCHNNPVNRQDSQGTEDDSSSWTYLSGVFDYATPHDYWIGFRYNSVTRAVVTLGDYLSWIPGDPAFDVKLVYKGGAEAVEHAGAIADVLKKLCFAAGTPVQMADGTIKPIEQIQAGDEVLSCNPQTGEVKAKTVTRTFVHLATRVVTIRLSDGDTITCTPEHPIYVEGQGFFPAGQLTKGSLIVTRKGVSVSVAQVIWHPETTGGTLVYNIEVEDDHTYFVGKTDGGIWVHNNCIPDLQSLKQALASIAHGDVRVATREEAEQIAAFLYAGFKNTTGNLGSEAEFLTRFFKNSGYYHYAEEIITDAETGERMVAGHETGNVHGTYRHVQFHPIPEVGSRGEVRRVFYGPLVH